MVGMISSLAGHNVTKTIFRLLAFSFLCMMALANVRQALAHARVELGPYVLIVGWENEPVIVGERNAIVIEVTEEGVPVEGLESSLDVEVLYAGRTFSGNLAPTSTPGLYAVELLPTVRGQYTVHLEGVIGNINIDEMAEPEEVLPASVLEFPESQPETRALQEEIAELDSRLQTAYNLAIIGVALGVIGVSVGVFSLVRNRSKT
jgi:hypothetical protein